VTLRGARIPSRETFSRVFVRFRQAGSLLRRNTVSSFRSDVRLLAELLLRGGILYVIADAAGAPAARVLIQPDADILMTVDRRCLFDPALRTRIRDEQQAMCARIASASRPIDAMWTGTHVIFAVAYVSIARQAVVGLQHWFVQTAVAAGIALIGMVAASVVRRVMLRVLLRYF
jgi:hypothetical protein